MEETKGILFSKTFWSTAVVVLSGLIQMINGFMTDDPTEVGTGVAAVVGGVFAIFSRVVATKRIR